MLKISSSRLAHQLHQNDSCILGPEMLPAAVKGLPYPSEGRKQCGSLLHKLPRWTAFALPAGFEFNVFTHQPICRVLPHPE